MLYYVSVYFIIFVYVLNCNILLCLYLYVHLLCLLTYVYILVLSEQSAVVVHVNGLLGTQGSLTCYLPVLIQGGLEDFLEGDGESATGHEIETEIGTGAETEAPVGTESQMGMEESSQIRPDNTDSMRSEGRKRKIQDDINSDEGENQGS